MTKDNSKGKKAGKGKWYWNWFSKQLYLIIVIFIGIFMIASYSLKMITRHNQELEVPSFIGMNLEQATKIANINNLRLEVTDSVHIPRAAKGAIFKQKPEAGSYVKKERRIILIIVLVDCFLNI